MIMFVRVTYLFMLLWQEYVVYLLVFYSVQYLYSGVEFRKFYDIVFQYHCSSINRFSYLLHPWRWLQKDDWGIAIELSTCGVRNIKVARWFLFGDAWYLRSPPQSRCNTWFDELRFIRNKTSRLFMLIDILGKGFVSFDEYILVET